MYIPFVKPLYHCVALAEYILQINTYNDIKWSCYAFILIYDSVNIYPLIIHVTNVFT